MTGLKGQDDLGIKTETRTMNLISTLDAAPAFSTPPSPCGSHPPTMNYFPTHSSAPPCSTLSLLTKPLKLLITRQTQFELISTIYYYLSMIIVVNKPLSAPAAQLGADFCRLAVSFPHIVVMQNKSSLIESFVLKCCEPHRCYKKPSGCRNLFYHIIYHHK